MSEIMNERYNTWSGILKNIQYNGVRLSKIYSSWSEILNYMVHVLDSEKNAVYDHE